jgi:hypothetical protein
VSAFLSIRISVYGEKEKKEENKTGGKLFHNLLFQTRVVEMLFPHTFRIIRLPEHCSSPLFSNHVVAPYWLAYHSSICLRNFTVDPLVLNLNEISSVVLNICHLDLPIQSPVYAIREVTHNNGSGEKHLNESQRAILKYGA